MSKHWFRAVTALSLAAVALALAAPVRGEEAVKPEKPKKHSFTGAIASVDSSAGTVTVKKGDESKTFKAGDKTKCSTGDKKDAAIADLKAGDKVTVSYTGEGDVLTALRIAPPAPPKKSE